MKTNNDDAVEITPNGDVESGNPAEIKPNVAMVKVTLPDGTTKQVPITITGIQKRKVTHLEKSSAVSKPTILVPGLLQSLALSIICLVGVMAYNGYSSVCQRWASYLTVAGFSSVAILVTLSALFCLISRKVPQKPLMHANVCTFIVLVLFELAWFMYGAVLLQNTRYEAQEECPSTLTDCFQAYFYIKLIVMIFGCLRGSKHRANVMQK